MGGGEVDVTQERGLWRALASPGVIWLILFVVVPAASGFSLFLVVAV